MTTQRKPLDSKLYFHSTIVIDDSPLMIRSYQLLLADRWIGENLVILDHPLEALHYLVDLDFRNRYLVFLDLNMPVLSGWELFSSLKKALPKEDMEKLFIYLATNADHVSQYHRVCEEEAIKGILEKPLTDQTIQSLEFGIPIEKPCSEYYKS